MGNRGCGKTSAVLLEAARQQGIVLCKNPQHLKLKAAEMGVLRAVEILGYEDYLEIANTQKPIFIDELDAFLLALTPQVTGYSLTIDD